MAVKAPEIVFEDNQILVALKPQNLPSQGDSSKDENMLDLLKAYIKQKYNKAGEAYLGLVHRLDRPTGGIMCFARTSKAAERLHKAMIDGEFEKKYLCVVAGSPVQKHAKLVHHLLKDEKNNIVRVVPFTTEQAKRAELDYRVLEERDGISLLEVELQTGRSHQIRVQLSTIGHPILGDAKYGGDYAKSSRNLCLWAYQLRFKHPVSKEIMVFKSFPPEQEAVWKEFYLDKYISAAKI